MGNRPYFSLRPSPITMMRKKFKLDQAETAKVLGIAVPHLEYFEAHSRIVTPASLACMAIMLAPSRGIDGREIWWFLASESERQAGLNEREA
jgi:DNA-binding XRE family transcriptional regulator